MHHFLAMGNKLFECDWLFSLGLEGLTVACVIIWFYLEFSNELKISAEIFSKIMSLDIAE